MLIQLLKDIIGCEETNNLFPSLSDDDDDDDDDDGRDSVSSSGGSESHTLHSNDHFNNAYLSIIINH